MLLRRCCRGAIARVRACLFWLAVGLPWLVLGLVCAGYVTSNPVAFTALFGGAVLCGVVSRDYRR
jgi:hypothetical protein